MKALLLFLVAIMTSQLVSGKIFTKCELAKKLSGTFPRNTLNDWNCLVKHESSYNSGRKSPKNTNGSYDYGIFQINDKYWCKVGAKGGDCNMDCNSKFNNRLKDADFLMKVYRILRRRYHRRHSMCTEDL